MKEFIVSGDYLPKDVSSQYEVSSAYVAKIGFVPSKIKSALEEKYWSDEGFGDKIKEYLRDIHSILAASPHVMEVTPNEEAHVAAFEAGEFPVGYTLSTLTTNFVDMRVVMAERRRQELGLFQHWSPEEFNLRFNGSLFLAYASIDEVPVFTDLGQIAREFLRELLAESKVVDVRDGIGPTPIHPEVYIVKVRPRGDEEHALEFPRIEYVGDDIVIIISDASDMDEILRPLLFELEFPIASFYRQRLSARERYDAIRKFEELNSALSGLLSDYFGQKSYARLFSSIPSQIRSTLASMHHSLQEISTAELETDSRRAEAIKDFGDSTILEGITSYFSEHMEPDLQFDRDSQLTRMNFAAAETGHLGTTQATLFAALIGALVGGGVTAALQVLGGD